MNHRRASLMIVLPTLLLSASLGGIALAAANVPIRGQMEGSVTATEIEGSENHYRLENHAVGTMSHLGRVEAHWDIPDAELDLVDRTITVADVEWSGTLVAANGDEIIGRYRFPQNTFQFSLTGDLEFETELEVTGGTGRFEGASGLAQATGRANVFTGAAEITMQGRLLLGRRNP